MRFNIKDLPERYQKQIAQKEKKLPIKQSLPQAPNQTEREAFGVLEQLGFGWEYHPVAWTLANGHRYTPDIVCQGAQIAVEVKGSYSHPSKQRSRVMFDQARIEKPGWMFIWMEKKKSKIGGWHWSMKVYG